LRLTGNHVRTAVWTLVHPATGRTVILVGTMHIGDATYFRNLTELLAGLAAGGAEIHVEGIARRDGDCLSEWEEDRLAEAGTWDDAETTGAAVNLLSLESQSVHLHLPDGTRNVDLSHVELLRRVGWDDYRRLFASPPEAPATPGFGPVARTAIRFQLRHSRMIEALSSLRPRNRRVNRVVIGERNRRAFEGATEALTRGDVVLVWGADHLPGIARLFTAAGYRLGHEAWSEACLL
jgi:pheromone shutdown protein TraB